MQANKHFLIDYDQQIKLTKKALCDKLKYVKDIYAEIISNLEKLKQEQEDYLAYQRRLKFSYKKDGTKYRVATDKMLQFARSIECATLKAKAHDFDCDCPDHVEFICDFSRKHKDLPQDSFSLIQKYIKENLETAKRIWDANRKDYHRQKEIDYKNSYQYEIDQRNRRIEEERKREEAQREKYEMQHRIYDGTGGYFVTGFGSNGMYVDEFGNT